MVLLVTVLLSLSALSAADNNDLNNTIDQSMDSLQTESVTNIESNSIENKVSNEYETITNENTSSIEKTITKQVTTNNTSVKSATTSKKSITITSQDITSYTGNTINIQAKVNYKDGEKLSYAKVSIKVNGNTIIHTTVSNGTISAKYTIPVWSAKKYNMEFIVGETSTSQAGRKNVSLTIKRHDLTVSMSSINTTSASKVQLKATVKYLNGTLANGQKAVFKVNGKTVLSTTVVNGIASGNYIVPVNSGTHTLIVKIGETTTTKYVENTQKIQVSKRTPTIVKDDLIFAKKGSYVYLHAKITGMGNANASGKISFKINGKTVATVNVINNSADYKYNANLKIGYHNVSIVYGGSKGLNAVRTTTSMRVQNDYVSTYSYAQILDKANSTHSFVLKNKRLPNFVTISGNQVSMVDLLYMFSQALTNNNSYHNGGFSLPSTNYATTKYGYQLSKEEYISIADRVVDFYKTYGRAPNFMLMSSGDKLSFNDTIYTLSKALSFAESNNRLPNYVTVESINPSTGSSTSSSSTSTYVPTNTVPEGFEKYLANANNSYVNATSIKNAVQKAVSGVSGTYNQAVAIFDYVNDVTSYSSYLNTRKGALRTLSEGSGNCVDQSHLLLGMYRTANIPARYCHATCYFKSGLVIGHVWIECYVNGKWYSCDTTSNQNSFNKIVNWYSSSTVYRYLELYF